MIPTLDEVMGLIVKEAVEVAAFPSLLEVEDLIQEGVLIYLLAGQKFDENRGAKFTTFLVFLLKQKLRQKSMRLPRTSDEDCEILEGIWEQKWLAEVDLSPIARKVLHTAKTMNEWAGTRGTKRTKTIRTTMRDMLGISRREMVKIEMELREALLTL